MWSCSFVFTRCLLVVTPHLKFLHSFYPCSAMIFEPLVSGGGMYVPFLTKNYSAFYSLPFVLLCVTVLSIIFCKKQPRIEDELIYEYKAIRNQLNAVSICSIKVAGTAPGLVNYIAISSQPDNDAWYCFQLVEQDLNPTQKWLVSPTILIILLHSWAYLSCQSLLYLIIGFNVVYN